VVQSLLVSILLSWVAVLLPDIAISHGDFWFLISWSCLTTAHQVFILWFFLVWADLQLFAGQPTTFSLAISLILWFFIVSVLLIWFFLLLIGDWCWLISLLFLLLWNYWDRFSKSALISCWIFVFSESICVGREERKWWWNISLYYCIISYLYLYRSIFI
jgi:hypothetical protein